MQEYPGEVEQVLDRMHRQPRPRPDVDVLVMQVVGGLVQRLPVDQAVHPVEVHLAHELHRRQQQHEVHRIGAEVDVGQMPVGVHPQRQRLVQRPHTAAAHQAPEHVVAGLIAKQERLVVGAEPAVVVLVALALRLLDVEPQVPGTEEQGHDRGVAQVDEDHPARLEAGHALHLRRQEQPRHDRHGHEQHVVRHQVAGKPEQPLEEPQRPRRPHEHRRRLNQFRGLPLPARVASPQIRFGHCITPSVGTRATA